MLGGPSAHGSLCLAAYSRPVSRSASLPASDLLGHQLPRCKPGSSTAVHSSSYKKQGETLSRVSQCQQSQHKGKNTQAATFSQFHTNVGQYLHLFLKDKSLKTGVPLQRAPAAAGQGPALREGPRAGLCPPSSNPGEPSLAVPLTRGQLGPVSSGAGPSPGKASARFWLRLQSEDQAVLARGSMLPRACGLWHLSQLWMEPGPLGAARGWTSHGADTAEAPRARFTVRAVTPRAPGSKDVTTQQRLGWR